LNPKASFPANDKGHKTCQSLSELILGAWSFAIAYLAATKLVNNQGTYLIHFSFLLSFVHLSGTYCYIYVYK